MLLACVLSTRHDAAMNTLHALQLQELRTRHLNNIDTRARCIRDVGSARQALQARQTALAKLQGEAHVLGTRGSKDGASPKVQIWRWVETNGTILG